MKLTTTLILFATIVAAEIDIRDVPATCIPRCQTVIPLATCLGGTADIPDTITQGEVNQQSTDIANCICPVFTTGDRVGVDDCKGCLNDAGAVEGASEGLQELVAVVNQVDGQCQAGDINGAAATIWMGIDDEGLQPAF